MPTAAKLVSAIAFAIVAYVSAHFYALGLPSTASTGALREVSAVVGVLCGWFVMGGFANRKRGLIECTGAGIRTSVLIVLSVIVIFACLDMIDRALKGRYKTPLDAFLGVFEQALALAPPLARPDVLIALLLGGVIGGALAHWAGQRWP